jgi:hypothetical protein
LSLERNVPARVDRRDRLTLYTHAGCV